MSAWVVICNNTKRVSDPMRKSNQSVQRARWHNGSQEAPAILNTITLTGMTGDGDMCF